MRKRDVERMAPMLFPARDAQRASPYLAASQTSAHPPPDKRPSADLVEAPFSFVMHCLDDNSLRTRAPLSFAFSLSPPPSRVSFAGFSLEPTIFTVYVFTPIYAAPRVRLKRLAFQTPLLSLSLSCPLSIPSLSKSRALLSGFY